MTLVEQFLEGLKQAYINNGGEEAWQNLMATAHGATEADLQVLRNRYPQVPESLLDLLRRIDGTYWRDYEKGTVSDLILGADEEMGDYPYYLLSAEQIVATQNEAFDFYADYINREYEEVEIDNRITSDASQLHNWLHFSDCMNNGGTSQLFIDFSPSATGKVGQVVRFLHDPDEMVVIADSFDDYLKMLMKNGYCFVDEMNFE
ncbi:SMI1/KNR4 family protein [Capnocytophaga sputigena]|mgnify:FL=1|uniref:SMI1/KNR4 family protein n=1 Tax=Capnocytophaga sputigena TaxID=1019 RepID=UPI00248DD05C|nr:SMI1/KNR4 family protein [Capnocytophaga sputigena]